MSNDTHRDGFHLSRTDQFKALAHPLRRRIIDLAGQRPATVAEFAAALERPPGTVAHHVHVLVASDLLTVVRTRQVRAVTEHTYGRSAPTFFYDADYAPVRETQAMADFSAVRRRPTEEEASTLAVRFLRLPHALAHALVDEFSERIDALARDAGSSTGAGTGDTVYGIVVAIEPTTIATLPPRDPDDADADTDADTDTGDADAATA